MGAWQYISDRLSRSLSYGKSLSYIGRPESASTATGSHKVHGREQERIVKTAFE
jgi:2-oxoglutarate dehydrogenase E1 component